MILHGVDNPVVVVNDLVFLEFPVGLPGDEVRQHQEDLLFHLGIFSGLVKEGFLMLVVLSD